MNTKRWRVLGAVLGIAVVGAAVLWWRGRDGRDPQYTFTRVERGDVVETVTATGTVNPITTVQVGSQVSGTIKKLNADFNSVVHRGQILAQLDTDTFQAQVAQATANVQMARAQVQNAKASLENTRAAYLSSQASLASAQANLEKAKAAVKDSQDNLNRSQALWQRNLIAARDVEVATTGNEQAVAAEKAAEAQVEQAKADLEAARAKVQSAQAQIKTNEAQVAQAEAALRQNQVTLAKATIYSPIDGTVVARNVDVGQTVAASLQAPTLFTIAQDLSHLQIDTSVAEADVGRVLEGQEVTFTVDAFPSQTFHGRVSQVRINPTTVQNVVTYDAVVAVDNPGRRLMPGMTAQVSIIIARRPNVLRLPIQALHFRPPAAMAGNGRQGGAAAGGWKGASGQTAAARQRRSAGQANRAVVWTVGRDRALRRIPVQTGISDGRFTEVISDRLKEGEEVITGLKLSSPSNGTSRSRSMFRRF